MNADAWVVYTVLIGLPTAVVLAAVALYAHSVLQRKRDRTKGILPAKHHVAEVGFWSLVVGAVGVFVGYVGQIQSSSDTWALLGFIIAGIIAIAIGTAIGIGAMLLLALAAKVLPEEVMKWVRRSVIVVSLILGFVLGRYVVPL